MVKKQRVEKNLESLDDIDSLIHSPTRLKILVYLYMVENMDYVYLKRLTDLTWGNLSKHLSRLEEAGYVTTEKSFENKKPKTTIWLTDAGREAFQNYKESLIQIFDRLPDE